MIGVSAKLKTNGNASQAVLDAERKYRLDAAEKGFNFSQEVVPVDRGAAGLQGSGFPPELRGDDVVWGYTAPHAEPMEYGTDPFYPPVQPLIEWAERVANDPGLGYYVAREKIPQEGIDAQPYIRPGANVSERWLKQHQFTEYYENEF